MRDPALAWLQMEAAGGGPAQEVLEELLDLAHQVGVMRADLQRLDCAYGELGGVHCPIGQPCCKCMLRQATDAAEEAK